MRRSPRITWDQLRVGLVIAVALAIQLLRPAVPDAHAAEDLRCTMQGPVEVKLEKVEIEWGFSQPGANSSNPLYVKAVHC